jgi:lipid A ethanolaminephosphotransferase
LSPAAAHELVPTGMDATRGQAWSSQSKKVVSIIVVGETARAENFSLNGYQRETNAQLKKEGVIYFNNVHSCGTSTAVSLPCMFSADGREHFDSSRQKFSENLLDVFSHAGLPVLWRDNNSGCKGLCTRVASEDPGSVVHNDKSLCPNGDCFDMVLMQQLQARIDGFPDGGVIVLHQKGSHGPAYYLRTPAEAQIFTPFCHTNQLQQCTRSEIVNAYDNTIVYTDFFLASVIRFLKLHDAEYDASLVYVSDHGESLGENGIYLHGLPWLIAPDQQTHIPMIVWLSDSYARRFQIDTDCLAANHSKPYNHDNLFPSLLGLLDIQTAAYNRSGDLFSECRTRGLLTKSQQTISTKG